MLGLYRLIKVDLPPPVSFWKFTNVWPYKTYGGKPHTICMGETQKTDSKSIIRNTHKVKKIKVKKIHRAPRTRRPDVRLDGRLPRPRHPRPRRDAAQSYPAGSHRHPEGQAHTVDGRQGGVLLRCVGPPGSTLRQHRACGSSLLSGRMRHACGVAPAPRTLRRVRCGH